MKGNALQSFVTGRHGSYLTQFYRPKTKTYPTRAAMRQAVSLKSIERRLVLPLDELQWSRALEVLNAGYAKLARTPEHYQRVIRAMVAASQHAGSLRTAGDDAAALSLPSAAPSLAAKSNVGDPRSSTLLAGSSSSGGSSPNNNSSSNTAKHNIADALDRLRDQAYAGEIPSNSSLFVTLVWAYCSVDHPEEAAETLLQCQRRTGFSCQSLEHVVDLVVPLLCHHGKGALAREILRETATSESRFQRALAEADALEGNWSEAVRRFGRESAKEEEDDGGRKNHAEHTTLGLSGAGTGTTTDSVPAGAPATSSSLRSLFSSLGAPNHSSAGRPVRMQTTGNPSSSRFVMASRAQERAKSRDVSLQTQGVSAAASAAWKEESAEWLDKTTTASPPHQQHSLTADRDRMLTESTRARAEISSLSTPAVERLLLACLEAVGKEGDQKARDLSISSVPSLTKRRAESPLYLASALWRELFQCRGAMITEELFYALLNCIGYQQHLHAQEQTKLSKSHLPHTRRPSPSSLECGKNEDWMEAVRWFVWMFLPASDPSKYVPKALPNGTTRGDTKVLGMASLFYRPAPTQFPSLPLTAVALNLVFGVYPVRPSGEDSDDRYTIHNPLPQHMRGRESGSESRTLLAQYPDCMCALLDDLLLHRDDAVLTNYMLSRVVPALLQKGQWERGFQLLRQASLLSPAACEAAASASSKMPVMEQRLQRDLIQLVYVIHAQWQQNNRVDQPSPAEEATRAATTKSQSTSLKSNRYAVVIQLPHLFPPAVRAAVSRYNDEATARAADDGFSHGGSQKEHEKAPEQETELLSDADRLHQMEEEQRYPTSLRRSWQHYFSQRSTAVLTEDHDAALKRHVLAEAANPSHLASFVGDADRDPRPAPRGLHDRASGWTYFGRGGEMVFSNSRRTPHPFSMHPKMMRSRADPYRGWRPRENSIHAHKENVVKWNGSMFQRLAHLEKAEQTVRDQQHANGSSSSGSSGTAAVALCEEAKKLPEHILLSTDPRKLNTQIPFFVCPAWAGLPSTGYHLFCTRNGQPFPALDLSRFPYYLFGKHRVADYVLDHPSISAIHAAIVYHRERECFVLLDLRSTNGVRVNGTRIAPEQPIPIAIGTHIQLGYSSRQYELRKGKPPSSKRLREEQELYAAQSSLRMPLSSSFSASSPRVPPVSTDGAGGGPTSIGASVHTTAASTGGEKSSRAGDANLAPASGTTMTGSSPPSSSPSPTVEEMANAGTTSVAPTSEKSTTTGGGGTDHDHGGAPSPSPAPQAYHLYQLVLKHKDVKNPVSRGVRNKGTPVTRSREDALNMAKFILSAHERSIREAEATDDDGNGASRRRRLHNEWTVEEFMEAVEGYSEVASKSKGDLGMVTRGSFSEEFEAAAFALERHQVSAPVETVLGIHLIYRCD